MKLHKCFKEEHASYDIVNFISSFHILWSLLMHENNLCCKTRKISFSIYYLLDLET